MFSRSVISPTEAPLTEAAEALLEAHDPIKESNYSSELPVVPGDPFLKQPSLDTVIPNQEITEAVSISSLEADERSHGCLFKGSAGVELQSGNSDEETQACSEACSDDAAPIFRRSSFDASDRRRKLSMTTANDKDTEMPRWVCSISSMCSEYQPSIESASTADEDGFDADSQSPGEEDADSEVHESSDDGIDNETSDGNETYSERGTAESNPESEVSADTAAQHFDIYSETESDAGWRNAMGSLSGHQLARAPYLKTLFHSFDQERQASMPGDVLGAGRMVDDRYHTEGEDLLNHLLGDVNCWLPLQMQISKNTFCRQRADQQIKQALHSMLDDEVKSEIWWHYFQNALSIRSQVACRNILCGDSFNFTSQQWADLEDTLKNL